MDCAEATTLLSAYVDGETNTLEQHSIGEHLHACPTCAASHGELLALRAQIRADVPRYSAPPELRTRVLSETDEMPHMARRWPGAPRRCLRGSSAPPCWIGVPTRISRSRR